MDWAASEKNSMQDQELTLLIKECLSDSRTAQKRLYEKYSPAAYGVIRRYIYNNDVATQEILNDAFYKIFTKLDQYSFQGAFEGWIRKIVVNTITDYLRKSINIKNNHKEIQNEDAMVHSNSVENISYKELLALVHALPDMQRAVFNLFVFENYSHKEIGTLLNMNENNSRWHLNDARRRLKEKILITTR
jgi:RNA polymerase sigma-70 factor (ECF subfamily)